jgi:peptidyl-prolyl cis-trans isomerase C
MSLRIHDTIIPDDAIARESVAFAGSPDPDAAARRSLAIRELLLHRAGELGLLEDGLPRDRVVFASRSDEDALIERVLDKEVHTPEPSSDECRRYYDSHPERFSAGELCEARHILFAVTPGTPVTALRERAESVLAELKQHPELFAERARELSNCPSGEQGGSLGQFGRGRMVREFDDAVLGTSATGVLPQLVATRYGFHVVQVERRIEGRLLPFEAVEKSIAAHLAERVQQRALQQYVEVLAGNARLEGVALRGANSPLVQ